MVVGGGIAGIQASLDLAEMGVEVFLIEHEPSIGGRMAQFLSPKLVEAGANKNIHIIANADVQSVEGEAPNFHVRILKRARYVDETRCTGCGICMSKCPVRIPDEYNKSLNKTSGPCGSYHQQGALHLSAKGQMPDLREILRGKSHRLRTERYRYRH
jgi:heterodisulfide reductase subunit A